MAQKDTRKNLKKKRKRKKKAPNLSLKTVIVGAYVTEMCSLASQKCQKIASIKRELCVIVYRIYKNYKSQCCLLSRSFIQKKKLSTGCTQRDTEMTIIAAYSSLLVHVKAISLL